MNDAPLGREPRKEDKTRQIDGTVVAVIPDYHQAKVKDSDGHLYAITEHTAGLSAKSLREGQKVRCTVTLRFPRVLSAELLA